MLPEMNTDGLLKEIAIIIVICMFVLHLESQTAETNYNTGYDDGYEKGYEEGYFDALEEYGIENK